MRRSRASSAGRAALLVAVPSAAALWWFSAMLAAAPRLIRRLAGRANGRSVACKGGKAEVHIYPADQYKPSNPWWAKRIAETEPSELEEAPEPPQLAAFRAATAGGAACAPGSAAAAELFTLDPEWAYLNHGSYGATFKLAMEAQGWYRDRMEEQPVMFMEGTALDGVARAAALLAPFVGADWRDVVPIVNATSGVNAVVNSLQLQRGDLLLMANTTYPAVRSTLARAADRAGASLVDISFTMEALLDEDAIVAAYAAAAAAAREAGGKVRLAVIDHCVSFPPVVMPVARICDALRAEGVPVMVDGAHALGAFARLDVPSLGCDYYVSNAHKWLCSPKGCAFLWAARARQPSLAPLATSHGYGLGFRAEFLWAGTADPTAWLCVPACLAALERLGGLEAVAAHNHDLVRRAAELLRTVWGVPDPAIGARRDGGGSAGLAAVRLPEPLLSPPPPQDAAGGTGAASAAAGGAAAAAARGELPRTPEGALLLQRHLRARWRIEVPVACVGGRLYCRISAQVYNRIDQYERLAEAVQQLRGDVRGAAGSGRGGGA